MDCPQILFKVHEIIPSPLSIGVAVMQFSKRRAAIRLSVWAEADAIRMQKVKMAAPILFMSAKPKLNGLCLAIAYQYRLTGKSGLIPLSNSVQMAGPSAWVFATTCADCISDDN